MEQTTSSTTPIQQFDLIDAPIQDIELDPTNPNVMSAEQMKAMRLSMQKYGYLAPIIIDKNNKICDGEHRLLVYREMGLQTIPAYKLDLDSEYDRRQLRQIMNKLHGKHDPTKDAEELFTIMQQTQDKSLKELGSLIGQNEAELRRLIADFHPDGSIFSPDLLSTGVKKNAGSLALRWGIPPFSVLDRRTQTWQERRRQWLDFGIASQQGRENVVLFAKHLQMRVSQQPPPTVSVFDPVLAEIMIRWFCTPSINAKILDPFCGGSVRGIVASYLGHRYIGIDLRPEQIDANNAQYEALKDRMPENHTKPEWICGDSRDVSKLTEERDFDFILTSPPYFKIEHYSESRQDLNNMEWGGFKDAYRDIIHASVDMLTQDRPLFVSWNVGNARDPDTRFYVDQQDITKQYFYEKGFNLHNELVLIHPAGSLPFRVNNMFLRKRTVPKQHEFVLIFYNGSHDDIPGIDEKVVEIPAYQQQQQQQHQQQ